MKQIIEQAAIAFANKCRTANIKGGLDYPYDELDMRNAFEEGAKWRSGQSPWISVKDRLPDDNDDLYIVLDTKVEPPACGVCDFDLNINKWVGAGGIIAHPTHWMPIPKFN